MSATTPAPRTITKAEVATVVALTLAALVLRVVGSNSGLWIDEIYSLVDFFRVPLGVSGDSFVPKTHTGGAERVGPRLNKDGDGAQV